ncbi:COX assembly mitochondrial protein 2 homolog [Teleopsis dalmanni]|uniref:COX assembly mitochondrial protein 2 homolog n=1 Tax=Teleopsis dalmanni TaxID=139649 RepID=UPI0018CC9C9A|nr:COX assembly mitochondrial protein 2 homolog [Teleopsis dalmanni]XP_037953741.1 COX assembly mitochondrial protein 2 homolog [Teleopsis dalmanni]
MHPDLSPHLHTPECNQLVQELLNCREENKLTKFLGICNSLDTALNKCLKQERIARSAANRAKSKIKLQEIHERMQADTST